MTVTLPGYRVSVGATVGTYYNAHETLLRNEVTIRARSCEEGGRGTDQSTSRESQKTTVWYHRLALTAEEGHSRELLLTGTGQHFSVTVVGNQSKVTLWRCNSPTFYAQGPDLSPDAHLSSPPRPLPAVEERHGHRERKLSLVAECKAEKETSTPPSLGFPCL